uniref:Uncharacterized protein n=1 Tax=Chromera velia CCMP2878 TaxID=1169474 RepID=A0A0G4IFE5_9ALVE|eukprot:Cvel_14014.t1-p1 / transcript=Cvel_14014.t1 / gene=Cvel_14014 / organism=Chromera_velia_CCMP2878 / gene_product=Protein dopey-2, putative / transcript_product=Protein dopey-2, putative / location=Cvel_scaffold981:1401-18070(+) / protein_length=2491 / sequence_SO=supercontig / SO=protein_coding / is_pseudo=false
MDERTARTERRRLEQEIQNVLQAFEKAKEWADLSNCLQKLHKSIQRCRPLAPCPLPFKEVVAKRLAQCLNPSLPSGVHVKTLETYAAIFDLIQAAGLSEDLATYSSGLFPFFSNAATHVKPIFIHVIQQYFLPLGDRLLPCLSGLLVSLLPGVEDEKSDSYEKVFSTLQQISEGVGESHFMCALWLVILRTSRVRLPALTVLDEKLSPGLATLPLRRITELLPALDVLVLRSLESVFEDSNELVKRKLLDVLIKHFPFSTETVLDTVNKVRLLRASLRLFHQREWSLTRRLLRWMTNQAEASDGSSGDLTYFREYVRDSLCAAVTDELREMPGPQMEATAKEPLRTLQLVCTEAEGSAPLLMRPLNVAVLEYVQRQTTPDKPWRLSIVEEAQRLFAPTMTDPLWVWESLDSLLQEQLGRHDTAQSLGTLQLSSMYLDELLVDVDAATLLWNLYNVLSRALRAFATLAPSVEELPRLRDFLTFTASLTSSLTTKQAAHIAQLREASGDPQPNREREKETLMPSPPTGAEGGPTLPIEGGVVASSGVDGKPSEAPPASSGSAYSPNVSPLWQDSAPEALVRSESAFVQAMSDFLLYVQDVATKGIAENSKKAAEKEGVLPAFEILSSLLIGLLKAQQQLLTTADVGSSPWFEVPPWLVSILKCCQLREVQVSGRAVRTFTEILKEGLSPVRRNFVILDTYHCDNVAKHLWNCLGDEFAGSHSEVVSLLLELHHLCEPLRPDIILRVIAASCVSSQSSVRLEAVKRYAVLWKYSHFHRPILEVFPTAMKLVLDTLDAPEPAIRHASRSWLTQAASLHVHHILDPIFRELLHEDTVRSPPPKRCYLQPFDAARVLYMFEKLAALVRSEPLLLVQQMQNTYISDHILEMNSKQTAQQRRESTLSTAGGGGGGTVTPHQAPPQSAGGGVEDPKEGTSETIQLGAYLESTSPPGRRLSRGVGGVAGQSRLSTGASFPIVPLAMAHDMPVVDYLDLVAVTALRFIQGEVSADRSDELTEGGAYPSRSLKSATSEAFHRALSEGGTAAAVAAQRSRTKSVEMEDGLTPYRKDGRMETETEDWAALNGPVRVAATEFLKTFLSQLGDSWRAKQISCFLAEPLLEVLAKVISDGNFVLQVQLLGLLRVVLVNSHHDTSALFSKKSRPPPIFPLAPPPGSELSLVTSPQQAVSALQGMGHAASKIGEEERPTLRAEPTQRDTLVDDNKAAQAAAAALGQAGGLGSSLAVSSPPVPMAGGVTVVGRYRILHGNFPLLAQNMIEKAQAVQALRPVAETEMLIPTLLKGLHVTYAADPDAEGDGEGEENGGRPTVVHGGDLDSAPLGHFVNFIVFAIKYLPDSRFRGVCCSLVENFCDLINQHAYRANPVIVLRLMTGLDGVVARLLTKYAASSASHADAEPVPTFSALTLLSLGIVGGNTKASEKERADRETVELARPFLEEIPNIIRACVGAVAAAPPAAVLAEEVGASAFGPGEGDVGGATNRQSFMRDPAALNEREEKADLDVARNREELWAKVVRLLSTVFGHFPQVFVEGCLSVWHDCFLFPPSSRSNPVNVVGPGGNIPLPEAAQALGGEPLVVDGAGRQSSTPQLQPQAPPQRALQGPLLKVLHALHKPDANPWEVVGAVTHALENFFRKEKLAAQQQSSSSSSQPTGQAEGGDGAESAGKQRESIIFHFTYSFLSTVPPDFFEGGAEQTELAGAPGGKDKERDGQGQPRSPSSSGRAEKTWDSLLRLVHTVLTMSKQPLSLLWTLAVLEGFDQQRHSHGSERILKDKKFKKDLADLVHLCCQMAGRIFHTQNRTALHPSLFDLAPPHPPASEAFAHAAGGLFFQPSFPDAAPGAGPKTMVEGPPAAVTGRIADRSKVGGRPTILVPAKDPVEVSALHALAVLTVCCAGVVVSERRTPLASVLIQALCDNLGPVVQLLYSQAIQALPLRYFVMLLLSSMPYSLYPACLPALKKTVLDMLNTTNFFFMDRRTLRCWAKVIHRVVLDDFQKLEMYAPPPGGLSVFSGRSDAESRAKHLKRISMLIFSCPQDAFVAQLPSILERLVESLRVPNAPPLYEQVFLAMRVLMLCVSPQYLTPLWPVLLTELIKVLSGRPLQDPQLVLAALKVVDLASVLELPEFHLHQWIFVSDLLHAADDTEEEQGAEDTGGEGGEKKRDSATEGEKGTAEGETPAAVSSEGAESGGGSGETAAEPEGLYTPVSAAREPQGNVTAELPKAKGKKKDSVPPSASAQPAVTLPPASPAPEAVGVASNISTFKPYAAVLSEICGVREEQDSRKPAVQLTHHSSTATGVSARSRPLVFHSQRGSVSVLPSGGPAVASSSSAAGAARRSKAGSEAAQLNVPPPSGVPTTVPPPYGARTSIASSSADGEAEEGDGAPDWLRVELEGYRKPLILLRKARTSAEVGNAACALDSQAVVSAVCTRGVDRDALVRSIEDDLSELPDVLLDWSRAIDPQSICAGVNERSRKIHWPRSRSGGRPG